MCSENSYNSNGTTVWQPTGKKVTFHQSVPPFHNPRICPLSIIPGVAPVLNLTCSVGVEALTMAMEWMTKCCSVGVSFLDVKNSTNGLSLKAIMVIQYKKECVLY